MLSAILILMKVLSPKCIDNTCARNESSVTENLDGVLPEEEEWYFTKMFCKDNYTHTDVRSIYVLNVPDRVRSNACSSIEVVKN